MRHLFTTAALILLFCSATVSAPSFDNYQTRINQALRTLDTLLVIDENESSEAYKFRVSGTVQQVRSALPETEVIDWNGTNTTVDNRWLHQDLAEVESARETKRAEALARVMARLRAIDEQLAQTKNASARSLSKEDANTRLREILSRSEYGSKKKEPSAFGKLLKRFMEWFESLFPKRRQSAGGTPWISTVAQYFVILLALAVIGYVIKLLLPRLARRRGTKKKEKREARIVLGEKLEPEKSANDLLSEAEALARNGDLRAAIRKAYIALLVELGDRKIISLAQHKTNRDYLRSLRKVEPLHGNVKGLTEKFERHWYGFAGATQEDWTEFRAGYQNALR